MDRGDPCTPLGVLHGHLHAPISVDALNRYFVIPENQALAQQLVEYVVDLMAAKVVMYVVSRLS